MPLTKILIVDDEPDAVENCRRILTGPSCNCIVETDPQRALDAIEREHPQVLVTDLRMPGLDGIDLLKAAKRIDPAIKVVLLTAYASIRTAVSSMRHGAFDYLAKPFTGRELRTVIQRALGDEPADVATEKPIAKQAAARRGPETGGEPVLSGTSLAIRSVRALVDRVAQTEAAVLLFGENGSGKERIARQIHAISPRHSKLFMPVDCLGAEEAMVEAELFGLEALRPTKSSGARSGSLEAAHGGTLFLDEVWGLSLRIQAKLLRALKEQRARRVNGSEFYRLDIRVIAASTKPLEQACQSGEFREDLYQHLSVVPVSVPPLRERLEDLEQLARVFMTPLLQRKYPEPVSGFGFTPDALAHLCQYAWPGNVRELQRVAERAAIGADGPLLGCANLPEQIRHL
ncbi:MAG: sigma-54-dependent Fis family transcriptional regulator [Nitrospiraceae bacterium]|nr:sigma-54-dependent Fis family transcriptional regulator [Nitrospiraceae bacterium]